MDFHLSGVRPMLLLNPQTDPVSRERGSRTSEPGGLMEDDRRDPADQTGDQARDCSLAEPRFRPSSQGGDREDYSACDRITERAGRASRVRIGQPRRPARIRSSDWFGDWLKTVPIFC